MLGKASSLMSGGLFFWYTISMDIEILYSPYEEAINTGLQMGSEHHVLPESMWLSHIKRETGRKDLFVYFHEYTEKWVLAHWIYPPWEVALPVCLELETMDTAPDRGGWISTEMIKLRCRAIDPEQKMIEKQLKNQNEEKRREKEENLGRRTETVEHLRRQGKIDEAEALKHANVHYSDEDTEIKECLRGIAKGKIITHG